MEPRSSSAFRGVPASDGRGVSSDSVIVWCLDRGQHKGKTML